MNIQPSPQLTCDRFCKTSFYRNLLPLVAVLLALGTFFGNPVQAANILINPGFEADGNHGSGTAIGGWTGSPGGPWYINSDVYAHSGNNYYKVWGAFNGSPNTQAVYQDKSSLPTSTYQADGWLFALPTDYLWSGDDADYAWLEVSFRDSGNNILALYKSDLFSDTLGSVPYATGIWYDFSITNVCMTNAPYTVIGSTNLLVAPAGTVKVRFQHNLYQLLYGGGSVYFDDANLNQISGPVPPQITQVYPGNMLFASNHISFHVTSASSSPISTSNIHLIVNGTDVSGSCSFSGTTPDISVLYNGLATNVWAYTASITVTDAYNFTASATMNFDTVQPSYVWEAEDYDFTNGLYYNDPILSATAQPNCYTGTVGVEPVDYVAAGNGAAPHLYRPNDVTGIGFASETARQKFLTAGVPDYTIGYIAVGDWMNYTRDIPAGTYNVYARLAGNAGATTLTLDDVTSGTPVNLGAFAFTGTDWGAYLYVALQDTNGNPLPITLSGHTILRTTLTAGGENQNFFMLVPAQPALPFLSNISPTNGASFATANTFAFTASSTATINNSGIHLYVNGADVTSGLGITGNSTNKDVTWPFLTTNSFYTVVIAVTNSVGSGLTRTIKFDTMSTGNFYVKVEDFDFNGGQYDTAGNGLVPNWYEGQNTSISNVDYNHDLSGNYIYRLGLATEITSDLPLPGYSLGSDYDVGYFNNGDWANLTRNYPAGKYLVYARLAGGNGTLTAYLDQVASGLGTTSQTTKRLGTWTANTGGWQNWAWVPLTDASLVTPAVVNVGGVNTLRVTSGGNVNANYFMFVAVQPITITAKTSGNNVVVSFPTQAGKSYRVFSKPSLTSGSWTLLTTVGGDGTVKSVNDSETGSQQFYQVTSP